MKPMRIPSVGKLIANCWVKAEEALREEVRKKFPDRDENIITELFHAELEDEFARVSKNGAVAQAFLDDLRQTPIPMKIQCMERRAARRVAFFIDPGDGWSFWHGQRSGEGDTRHSRNAARGRTACLIAHDVSHSAQYYARK